MRRNNKNLPEPFSPNKETRPPPDIFKLSTLNPNALEPAWENLMSPNSIWPDRTGLRT